MGDPFRVFVKANLKFSLDGRDYVFAAQNVSATGIAPIRWMSFPPDDRVGEEVRVEMDLYALDRPHLNIASRITSEQTSDAAYLGLRFYPTRDEKQLLEKAIESSGFFPTAYVRKYPRIPAIERLSDMPLRAIVEDPHGDLIVLDIANISPTGILLHTENPKAAFLMPDMRVLVRVEPRGSSFEEIHFSGMICRVTQQKNPETKNIARFFGIRFLQIHPDEKVKFLTTLKSVLEDLREK